MWLWSSMQRWQCPIWKLCQIKYEIVINVFVCSFSAKVTCAFLACTVVNRASLHVGSLDTTLTVFFYIFFRLVPTVDLMELMTGRNLNGWTNSQSKLIKWYLHVTGVFIFLKNSPPNFHDFKGVFPKNEREYRLTAKNNRFWSSY